MVIGYMIMIFITNKFGAQGYGEYALAITILSVALVFSKFGLDTSIVRIIGEAKLLINKNGIIQILKKTFVITFVIGIFFSLLFLNFSDEIAVKIINSTNITNELELIGWLIIPATIIYLIAAYFQAYKKVVIYMLFNTFLLNIILLSLLVIFEYLEIVYRPFYLYALSICITFLIAIIILLFSLNSLTAVRNRIVKYNFSKILRVSLPMLLSSSFILIINWSDIIMLSIFSTEKNIGIYNASQRISEISSITLFAINAIATPKFVEFYSKNDMKGLQSTVVKSTKLILISSFPILTIFILFPKTILSINGPEFILGYMALTFLCIGKFFNSISGSVGYILQMTNNQKAFQNVMFLAAMINIFLNYLFIPKFGYNGAAFASMITVIVWNTILVVIIKRKLGFWTVYNPFIKS